MKRIAVIGAGMTGLSACHFLEEKLADTEFSIDCFDAADRTGGVIKTVKKDGFVLDCGPDCFIVDKPAPIRIAEKLGFEQDLVNTRSEYSGTYIYANGRLHLMPEGVMMMVPTKFMPFVTSGLFSWPGKLRMGLDLFIPRRKNNQDESLASFVRRRLGEEALDRLADPLVAGIHGSDPETMSLRATFPRFLEMEEKHRSLIIGFIHSRRKAAEFRKKLEKSGKPRRTFFVSFKHGMQQLTDGLKSSLKKTVFHTGTPVRSIEKLPVGFRLVFADGSHRDFDAVVVTTPAYVSAELLPDQLEMAKRALAEIPYSSSATISLAFKEEQFDRRPNGYGFVVAASAGLNILAGTFSSNKWPFRAPDGYVLVRTFIGGAKNSHLVDLSDDELVQMALSDLKKVVPFSGEPEFYHLEKMKKSMPQYTLGHIERVDKIFTDIDRIPGLELAGSAFTGVGIGDCIRYGEKAAEKVSSYLKNR